MELMERYWPGALTIIFNKNQENKVLFNTEFNTIAFRIPSSNIALSILSKFGPMATTSVNISGSAPLNSYEEINNYFKDQIDYIISDVESLSGVSSTIIDATKNPFVVIREGSIKL